MQITCPAASVKGGPSVVHLLCVVFGEEWIGDWKLERFLCSVRELFHSRAGVVRGVIFLNESYIYP